MLHSTHVLSFDVTSVLRIGHRCCLFSLAGKLLVRTLPLACIPSVLLLHYYPTLFVLYGIVLVLHPNSTFIVSAACQLTSFRLFLPSLSYHMLMLSIHKAVKFYLPPIHPFISYWLRLSNSYSLMAVLDTRLNDTHPPGRDPLKFEKPPN